MPVFIPAGPIDNILVNNDGYQVKIEKDGNIYFLYVTDIDQGQMLQEIRDELKKIRMLMEYIVD